MIQGAVAATESGRSSDRVVDVIDRPAHRGV